MQLTLRLYSRAVVVVLSSMLFATSVQATIYGDFVDPGGTVSFLDVEDQHGLFGAPTVSLDTLDFTPNAFEADCALSATCPPTPVMVDDTLTITIQAKSGSFITDIILNEAGDTTLFSLTAAIGATVVTATVFIDIFEIDGSPVNNINGNAAMVFTSDGTFDTTDEGNGTHIWTGLLSIDIDQMIADANLSGQATRVELSLDNTLIAIADSGAVARIEKKDIDGLAITVIPEPGTALLMGLGLVVLASSVRSHRFAG